MLSDALAGLPVASGPDLLVGYETADDAAVYRLSPEIAVISTVDYITPVVDDPVWFGRVAAANSLSDVWAMGGEPVLALNVVNFPANTLEMDQLRGILKGAAEKVAEAGAALGGGHSVEDAEPKFGLAVTGVVHPERILTNRGARPGDALVLTKPLGSGVLFNANRAGKLPPRQLENLLSVAAALNGTALRAALAYEVHGLTDITGFGLGGHGLEMAVHSGVRMTIDFRSLPLYDGAMEMYARGVGTGSNKGNRRYCGERIEMRTRLREREEEIIFDPQTSGGLLLSLPPDQAESLIGDLHGAGLPWSALIGTVEEGAPGIVIS